MQLRRSVNHSPAVVAQAKRAAALQAKPKSAAVQRQDDLMEDDELLQGQFAGGGSAQLQAEEQPEENRTGMPDRLKAGLENLSGFDLSGVRVHRNSAKPAQLNALAYAQGQEIHLGPGQERHLPHEGWHLVQQMQGRVKQTNFLIGKVTVNDDPGLEKEADVMGAKALQMYSQNKHFPCQLKHKTDTRQEPIQCVKAYRVEYSHNRKVIDNAGTVTGLIAPIDISFVLPDHSDYFASERNQEQLKGLRVVEWSMNDD